jgi:hypothetical protein
MNKQLLSKLSVNYYGNLELDFKIMLRHRSGFFFSRFFFINNNKQ